MADSEKNSKRSNTLRNNLYMIRLAYNACPSRVCWDIIMKIVSHVRQVFYSVIFIRFVFNALERQFHFKTVALFIIISSAVFFILDLLRSWYNKKLRPITDQILYENLNLMLFDKATDAELACYENPEFYNKYTKATTEANNRAVQVLDNLTEIIGTFFSSAIVLYVMLSLDPYAVLFSIVPILTTYTLGKKINKLRYTLNMANVPSNRKKDYVKRTVYLQNFAKEIRLSNIFAVMNNTLSGAIDETIGNIKKYGPRLGLLRSLQESINQNIILFGAIIYATVKMLVFKTLLIGDYIVLVNAIMNLSWSFVIFSNRIISMSEHSLYIDNLRDFLDYIPKIAQSQDGYSPKQAGSTLTLNNISFTYEGQSKPVLKNVCMEIRPKQKIAIVGHNGAGKTTLVKLILRLYDVTDGAILLDGINIGEYNVMKYRALFGTVFQDYQVLSMSVAENVLMRQVKAHEMSQVEDALKESGVYEKVMRLKNGINTTLTREFDREGAVLSGGEYQKIAVARVFAKNCSFAILDEPSSALDPIAEYHMYESMMRTCKDKTVLFISHRLSSAVLADKIYMMENGEIIEQGSHYELMNLNGKYAEMYRMQAEKYVGESIAI